MIPSTSPSDRIPAANIPAVNLRKSAAAPTDPDGDSLSTEKAEQLGAALAGQPEIRPEVVARGLALASDPNYPSTSVIRSVASQILASPDLTEDQS
jgi:hypothetical protein